MADASAPEGAPTQPDPPADDGSGGLDGESEPNFVEMDPSGRFGRWDQVLGRGAFKVVYKAFDTQEGTEVAWNQVRVTDLLSTKDDKEERDRLFAEIRVLKALKHKNIMSFYDSWYEARTGTINFITELFTSGTLRQYRKKHKRVEDEVLKRWAWQILCGLVYLHGHNPPIIHRDLKCDNIFINGSDGVVKIGDLGLATMLRSRTAPQSCLGTPEFMAPELYEEEYDDRVDVYSFGMCLLELCTMEYPYSECKNAAQIYRKVSLGVRPMGLQKVPNPELAEFINVCISSREARPRARQLLKHLYFETVRRDYKCLMASRSDAALHGAGGSVAEAMSDWGGGVPSNGVSRSVSSVAEALLPLGGPWQPGPLSASSSTGGGAGLSRTVSAAADGHSDRHSDAGSVRSQRSNASDLAAVALEGIAEEGESSDSSEGAAGGAVGRVAGRLPTPQQPQQQPGSWPGSAHGSPQRSTSPGANSPTGSSECRCESTERRFVVSGRYLEDANKLNLRLRICEPGGNARTVEFDFDLASDTEGNVAEEMVEDLQLSEEDAAVIAGAIKDAVGKLTRHMDGQASASVQQLAEMLQDNIQEVAMQQANSLDAATLAAEVAAGREEEQEAGDDAPALPTQGKEQQGAAAAPALSRQQQAAAQPVLSQQLLQPMGGAPLAAAAVHSSSSSSLASTTSTQSSAPAAAAAAAPAAAQAARPTSPPSRPLSPVPAGAAAAGASLPSPSQRVVRSNSIDASALLGGQHPFQRTASLPPGRDAVASPLSGPGSGQLSPAGGSSMLSPSQSAGAEPGKRPALNQLFENLHELARAQQPAAPAASLPLLNGSGARAAPFLRPMSEAHLPMMLARQLELRDDSLPGSSGPGSGAAGSPVVEPSSAVGSSSTSPRSHASFPGSGVLADAVAQMQAGGGALSAPVSKLPSRDVSPARDGSLSPMRLVPGSALANGGCTALVNGLKKPAIKDKEALRRQAADAMRAVELRSLNLLEGGLLGGKATRGVPMAASKSSTNLGASMAAAAPAAAPAPPVAGAGS